MQLIISMLLQLFCDVSVGQLASRNISLEEAAKYLSDFGYLKGVTSPTISNLPSSETILRHDSVIIRNALKKFQEFAGLKSTGKLDPATVKKMLRKRCGRPDVMALQLQGKYKWERTDLTYVIKSITNELSSNEVREALRRAFDTWSAVTRLKLHEISTKADITVAFVRLMHNDPWPFDGKGGVLAHATLPSSGILHFDSDETWVYMNPKYDTTDLLQVAVHEVGHVLGLEHSSDPNSIMAPFYREVVDSRGHYIIPKLSETDIKNIQNLYGINNNKSRGRNSTTESGPDLRIDPSNDDDELSNERNLDIGCPDDIDGIITTGGSNYLFSGSNVYEFDRTGVKKTFLLKKLFPNGPPFVQGALSNPRTNKTLLFHDKMVFAYQLEKNRKKFTLGPNYPKKLPADLKFKPMGAFLWHEGSQVLTNGYHFATYDENWNRVTLQNEVPNYFDNFPARPIRGIIIRRMKVLLFGDDRVYKYDITNKRVIGKAVPLKTFLHC